MRAASNLVCCGGLNTSPWTNFHPVSSRVSSYTPVNTVRKHSRNQTLEATNGISKGLVQTGQVTSVDRIDRVCSDQFQDSIGATWSMCSTDHKCEHKQILISKQKINLQKNANTEYNNYSITTTPAFFQPWKIKCFRTVDSLRPRFFGKWQYHIMTSFLCWHQQNT